MTNIPETKFPFDSEYQVPSSLFKSPHLQTLYARFLRPYKNLRYRRERIRLKDDDFLDLDWSEIKSQSLVIISPGFEGSSKRSYMRSTVSALNDVDMDAVVVNLRGCSGVPSHKYFFGTGDENDFSQAVDHILENYNYEEIFLVGYSTGANLVLKYTADKSKSINPLIKKLCAISPTLDLFSTVEQLNKKRNLIYLIAFLFIMLKRLIYSVRHLYRGFSLLDLLQVTSPERVYNRFCYPVNETPFPEFLRIHSSYDTLKNIGIKTMIICSYDDSFLDDSLYEELLSTENDNLEIIVTEFGGHAAFVDFSNHYFWAERKMINFFEED